MCVWAFVRVCVCECVRVCVLTAWSSLLQHGDLGLDSGLSSILAFVGLGDDVNIWLLPGHFLHEVLWGTGGTGGTGGGVNQHSCSNERGSSALK